MLITMNYPCMRFGTLEVFITKLIVPFFQIVILLLGKMPYNHSGAMSLIPEKHDDRNIHCIRIR